MAKQVVGSLETVLTELAEYTGVFFDDYWYAIDNDKHDGWDFGNGSWPVGSLHKAEGQTLYALVYGQDMTTVVECGSLYGCSSTHIAEALKVFDGHLTSVDVLEGTGKMMPMGLKRYVTQLYMKGEDYLNSLPDNSVDMVFEDTDHSPESVYEIWKAAIAKVRSGGVVISHDAMHETSAKDVNASIVRALGHDDYLLLSIPPADCGFAVWVKP